MKEHTATYNSAKKLEPGFDKASGSITDVREMQRIKKLVKLYPEGAISKNPDCRKLYRSN